MPKYNIKTIIEYCYNRLAIQNTKEITTVAVVLYLIKHMWIFGNH